MMRREQGPSGQETGVVESDDADATVEGSDAADATVEDSDAADATVGESDAADATDAGTTTTPDATGDARGDPAAVTDTFTLLSDETRVRIVLALYDAPDESIRFSDLRSRVGVRDGGRFNYHLDKLRGHLVEKTGAGYALTDAGERVASLV